MSLTVYPNAIDDSNSLPVTIDLVTPIKATVVNSLRDAIIGIESTLGIKPSGTYGTVRARLDALEIAIGSGGSGGGGGTTGPNRISAYGSIILTSSSVALSNGLNLGILTRLGIGKVQVSFIHPLATSYSVVASSDTDGGSCTVSSKTANGFIVERGNSAGSAVDDNFSVVIVSESEIVVPPPFNMTPVVAWCDINLTSSGAVLISGLNISSVLRTDVGSVSVFFSSNVNTSYAVIGSPDVDGGTVTAITKNAGGFTVERGDASGVAFDGNFSLIVTSTGVTIPVIPPTTTNIPCWGNILLTSGGATLTSGVNVGLVTRTAVGSVSINFGTAIGVGYAVTASPLNLGGEVAITSRTSTGITVERSDEFGVASDRDFSFSLVSGGIAQPPPPPHTAPVAFSWGRIVLTSLGASLSVSYGVLSVIRLDTGTVQIQLSPVPAFTPYVVIGQPVGIAGSVVETSQSGGTIVMERGDLFGIAADLDFSFVIYSNG